MRLRIYAVLTMFFNILIGLFSTYIWYYLKKAQGVIKINTQIIPLLPHTVIFIPVAQITDITNAQLDDGLFLFFEGEFLDKFFNEKNFIFKYPFFNNSDNPLHLHIVSEVHHYFYTLLVEIHQEIRLFKEDSEHLIRALLYQLLIKVNRLYIKNYPDIKARILMNEFLLRFKYELEKSIRTHSDVQYYAQKSGISRVYLNKLCKEYFAKTPLQIIHQRLALEIKKELLYSTKSIAEIAYELNFSDPPNCIRFFKQMTAQTPQQFRELSK